MIRAVIHLVVVVVVALLPATASAAAPTSIPGAVTLSSTVPAPSGLEARLIKDAADGALDDVDLVSAALVASGVADADVAASRARLLERLAPARARAKAARGEKARGDQLLRGLHDTVLRRYVETQSRVDVVVAGGEFNCLSSAVLFAIAADGLVSAPRGMLSRTHAFVRVDADGRPADVETTTRGGFAVDRKALVTREFLRERGVGDGLSDEERLRDLQHPEEVSLLGLVAALYSNRAVLAIREGDVDEAALAFDRANRLATGALKTRVANWRGALLNNAAAGLLREGRAAEARSLLRSGLDGATGSTRSTLQQNLVAASVRLAEDARAAGRLREALLHVDDALAGEVADVKLAGQLRSLRAELDGRLAQGDARRCDVIAVPVDRARCLVAVAEDLLAARRVDEAVDVARAAVAASSTEAPLATLFNALLAALEATRPTRDCVRADAVVRELAGVAGALPKPPSLDEPRLFARCHWERAAAAIEAGELEAAGVAFARAAVHLPDDVGLRQNRAEVELRRADALGRAGRCDEARPLVRRGVALRPDAAVRGERLLEACANDRALAAARASRWEEAALELRRGLVDAPGSEVLQKNLRDVTHNVVVGHLGATPRRCDDARQMLPELRAQGLEIVSDVERLCP
jgi:tetratricopeptide (TPR) repeat protein